MCIRQQARMFLQLACLEALLVSKRLLVTFMWDLRFFRWLPPSSPPMVGADAFVGANRHGLSSTAMCAKNAALSMRQQALRDLPLLQSPSAHAWSRPLLEPSALVNRPARQTEGSRLREDFLLLQLSKQHPFATPSATSAHLRFLQAEERKRLGVIKADPSGDIGDMVRPVKRVKMY
ncbi:unknown protein [Seminavis robusta]|uniref:Uncharacterized protein n=1 Tax=Seminavis robusta TaxID=568900 RepID=A0A9N8HV69_9STRA|nr:unknown protein [Seminavis robusta]|eukprot:Sro1470_g275370.1 n/a (177) ;mRNA; f:1688-2218